MRVALWVGDEREQQALTHEMEATMAAVFQPLAPAVAKNVSAETNTGTSTNTGGGGGGGRKRRRRKGRRRSRT
jgi:hypothetical protein